MEAVMFGQDRTDHEPRIANIGYRGPGAWVTISTHVGPRLSEWSGSFHMMLWGYVLLSFTVFDSKAFMYFKAIFGSQELLGAVLFAFGFFGIIGLVVNGFRKEVTPWVRFARAFVGFWAFLGMSTCFALSGVMSTWLAIYPVLAAAELVNMARTSYDAGSTYGNP